MNKKSTALLVAGLAGLSLAAHAQATFSIGPKASYSLSSAHFTVADYPDYFSTFNSYRSGFEAGVVAQVGFGNHWAVQPALLYARKALGYGTSSYYQPNNYGYYQEYTLGLNYLTLPVNVAYSLRPDGQGLQAFAGPYVGLLLGGNYQFSTSSGSSYSAEGKVKAGEYYTIPAPGTTTSDVLLHRFDVGVQAGLGYRVGKVLAQVDFAFGLRDLAPTFSDAYSRTAQASLSYLFGSKN